MCCVCSGAHVFLSHKTERTGGCGLKEKEKKAFKIVFLVVIVVVVLSNKVFFLGNPALQELERV